MYITEEVKELIKELRKYVPDFEFTEEEAEAIKKEDPNFDFAQDLKDAIIFRKFEPYLDDLNKVLDKIGVDETSQNNENYQFGLGNILVSDPV